MEKKYQVFVSSTYADLKEERAAVTKAILDIGHIPAGMELFPATDTSQMSYIKKVIDECDYYLIVIGGRYGSIDTDGISFTEKEYNYAVEKKIPVLAFLHGDPKAIPSGKVDMDSGLQEKLTALKGHVSSGRLVKFWTSPEDLQAKVIVAVQQEIGSHPAIGWIRANAAASEELLRQMNELRNKLDAANAEVSALKAVQYDEIEGLSGLDDNVTIRYKYTYRTRSLSETRSGECVLTWGDIFGAVGPGIISPSTPYGIRDAMTTLLNQEFKSGDVSSINASDIDTIKMHLFALGLIDVYSAGTVKGGQAEFVSITNRGLQVLKELKSHKRRPIEHENLRDRQ